MKYFRQMLYRKSKHTLHVNNLLRKSCFYEIMWRNIEQPDRSEMKT